MKNPFSKSILMNAIRQARKRRYIGTKPNLLKKILMRLFERHRDDLLFKSSIIHESLQNPNISLKILQDVGCDHRDWHDLSVLRDPLEILDVVKSSAKCYFNRNSLSQNPEITTEFMEEYDRIIAQSDAEIDQWNYGYLSNNKNISIESAVTGKYKWPEQLLIFNANLTLDFVKKHPDIKWDWNRVMTDLEPPLDDPVCVAIMKLVSERRATDCLYGTNLVVGDNAEALSHNPNITAQFIVNNNHLTWDWLQILGGSYDIENVMQICPDLLNNFSSVNWGYLSNNENITMDIIVRYKDAAWNWCELSEHSAIIAAIMRGESPPDKIKLWDWFHISYRVVIEDVLRWPTFPWNWESLSKNPNITMDIITERPHGTNLVVGDNAENRTLPWDNRAMLKNPNITWPVIVNMFDNVFPDAQRHVFRSIIGNKFLWNEVVYLREIRRDIDRKHDLMRGALDAPMPIIDSIARYIDWM